MSSAWDGLLNTPEITELPHYAFGKKAPEDAYFTRRGVAEHCVDQFYKVCKQKKISLRGYTFVEPSAGEGCFYDSLPRGSIGIDLHPKRKSFVACDYLQWYPSRPDRKYAVIGNPPFGHRGAMALAFVNRSLLFADLVAFILPMSFFSNGKGVNMKRVQGATLIHNEKLDRDSFYDPESGNPEKINTVFQIWQKGQHKSVFRDYDISEFADIFTCCSLPDRYCGLNHGRKYDCFIASTFYGGKVGVVDCFDDVQYGSGYGIIVKKHRRSILSVLKGIDWTQYCSDATNSCRHIRMYHIRKALGERGYGEAS